jgi:hypothetical protein
LAAVEITEGTPARSLRAMASLATPMAVRVAATLRLADRIGDAGATAVGLAAETGTSATALARVLDHLVAIGVLTRANGRYRLTPLGGELRTELLDELDVHAALGRAELAFVELLHTVTTGGPAYPRRYGRDFWADLAAAPELRESFDAESSRRFRDRAARIAEGFDWSRFATVVDVGGGPGRVLTAILTAHPRVRGRLVDLAPTAVHAAEEFAAAGLGDRAEAVPGSFFDPLPAGADAYLLSDVLHDWDDQQAHAILARCGEAAGTRGTVLVLERLRGEGADTATDLATLVFFGGRERTAEELADLAAPHGLVLASVTPVAGDRTLLEFGFAAGPVDPGRGRSYER